MKTWRLFVVGLLLLVMGCHAQKMSQAEADFSRKWIAASPTERRSIVITDPYDIVHGYLARKNSKAVEAFLGKPTSVLSDGTFEYQTVGRQRILVHFEKGKATACTIIG